MNNYLASYYKAYIENAADAKNQDWPPVAIEKKGKSAKKNMLNSQDQENLVKSSQTAELLLQDLRELVKSSNPLLSDSALEILEQAVKIEQRLNRIVSITQTE